MRIDSQAVKARHRLRVHGGVRAARAAATGVALALAAALAVGAEGAGSDIIGVWATQGGKSHVQIEPCGTSLCGRVVWLSEPLNAQGRPKRDKNNPDPVLQGREVVGMQVLKGFEPEPQQKGHWHNGAVYDPESGRTYRATLKLTGQDELELHGYVGIPLFGRSTTWIRLPS